MSLRLMEVDEASGAAVVDERPPKYVVALTGASQAAVGPRATEGEPSADAQSRSRRSIRRGGGAPRH